jgi:exopolysaccharide production protein ExoZ
MSERPEQFVTIQYLRGVAALLVVWLHATAMTAFAGKDFAQFGRVGVDIFFVISGFIMWTTTSAGRRPTDFWRARIIRIVPLYWLFTLVFIAGMAFTPGVIFNSRSFDLTFLLRSLLFIPTKDPSLGTITPVYAPGWTLNFEMFFYFVFGWALLIASRRARAATILGVFLTLNLAGYLFNVDSPIWSFYTHPMLLEFCFGIVIALNVDRIERQSGWFGALLIVAAMACFAANTVRTPDGPDIFSGAGAVLVVAGVLTLERLARRRIIPIAKFLGDASYSMYLAHPFAQRAVFIVLGKILGGAILLEWYRSYICFAFVVGAVGGALSFWLLEKPLLKIARTFAGSHRTASPSTTPEAQSQVA